MRFLVALPIVAFVVTLAWGALTGRVRARGCCAPDAAHDLRLRDISPLSGQDPVTPARSGDRSG